MELKINLSALPAVISAVMVINATWVYVGVEPSGARFNVTRRGTFPE